MMLQLGFHVIYVHIHGTSLDLWQGAEALKSAPVIPDENQINILLLPEAEMKPVTSLMSLLPGMTVNCHALIEK